ncbi:DNRLRE domain-containing protein, partial [Pseudomonas tremae]|uniref:CBM96 family carbohydrate-binding protein n=1 Tax=Pseudomonas tremae TaxID=200454 RepID=UPI00210B69AC
YGGSPDRIAYFKFDVSGLAGKTVTSAVLSTSNQITDGSLDVARGDFHAVTGSWSESAMTYQNRPQMGATVGSMRVDRSVAWSSADLTAYVSQLAGSSAGTMSLALTQDNVTTDAVIILTSARESNRVPY